MAEAEKLCGCRPWDYPAPASGKINGTNGGNARLCDFFGSSCFHSVIANDITGQVCRNSCVAGCSEVKYTISVERVILDETKICLQNIATNHKFSRLDHDLKMYIMNNTNFPLAGMGKYHFLRYLNKIKQTGDPWKVREKFYIEYCKRRIRDDMAIVDVVITTPTVTRYVQTKRVSTSDQLAIFGKLKLYVILQKHKCI